MFASTILITDLNTLAVQSRGRQGAVGPADSASIAHAGLPRAPLGQLMICILKIATFNINNINKRLKNLVAWLGKASQTWFAFRS
jgi:hypothetical protein